jgi:hypothetical protein
MSTPSTRLPDWQLRLADLIAKRQTMPFAWGQNDCALFAADCVQAITGQDPAPAGLRRHRTAKQACRQLVRHGGLASIASSALGQPRPAAFAQVGDVVLAAAGKRPMLAVCNGCTAMAPGPVGLVQVPIDPQAQCWRVA